MKILVISCDKYADTFELFHYCMEKYWPDHPEVYYATESVINPYYKTLCHKGEWTNRISEAVKEIDDNHILIMCDDVFIRQQVNVERLKYIDESLDTLDNAAQVCLIASNKPRNDLKLVPVTGYDNIDYREKDDYQNGVNCSLWKKYCLLDCLSGPDCDVWHFEYSKDHRRPYKYYVLSNDSWAIHWGRENEKRMVGLVKGKWMPECIDFFTKEGVKFDWEKRGISKYHE